jgi:pyruvate dehydrogenase E2 component (dihydrolipoamide acetyltransferase)
MPIEIIVPRLGWSMEEGAFVAWLKQDGELVKAVDLLFSIEGDKAVQEIESIDSGILRIAANGPKPGDSIGQRPSRSSSSANEAPLWSRQSRARLLQADTAAPPTVAELPLLLRPHGFRPIHARSAISPRAVRVARNSGGLDEGVRQRPDGTH